MLEVTDKATSVTLLLILLIGGLMSYYLLKEVRRQRTINQTLWERLMAAQQAQTDLAWRCSRGEEP